MKSGRVICLFAVVLMAVLFWIKNMPLPQKTPQETAFCVSLQGGKLNFKEGFLYERFISSEEFETLQNVRIALKKDEYVVMSVLGGERIANSTVGFVVRRPDDTRYSIFLHFPGNRSSEWDEQRWEYKYAGKKVGVNFVTP